MKKIYLLLIFLVFIAGLWAELEQSLIGADSLRVGSRFGFELRADKSLKQAIIPDTLSVFKVLKNEVIPGSGTPDHIALTLMPMRLGALSFPELKVIAEDGTEYQSDRFRVQILSVRAEGDTLLRDITPIKRYHLEPDFRLFIALAILGLILLILLIIRLLKRSKDSGSEILPQVVVPNWKRALEMLSELLKTDLLTRGQYVAFHYRLSEILRSYLEAEHRFNAAEMTTFEIRLFLRERSQKIPKEDELISFLRSCDLVKYAKQLPSDRDVQERIEWLQNYLVKNSEAPVDGHSGQVIDA
jgi:hypothetical protein